MITYPVDVVGTRWAIYQVSTQTIIGRNKVWPVADGSEIPDLDPDFVYLLHVNDTPPDYDSRLYLLDGQEGVDVDANVLHLSWTPVARPIEERVDAAENEESNQLARHIRIHRELIETRLMVGALLFYVLDGQQLPPAALNMADTYKAKALKLWQNRNYLINIITALENGEDPNMDDGWETP